MVRWARSSCPWAKRQRLRGVDLLTIGLLATHRGRRGAGTFPSYPYFSLPEFTSRKLIAIFLQHIRRIDLRNWPRQQIKMALSISHRSGKVPPAKQQIFKPLGELFLQWKLSASKSFNPALTPEKYHWWLFYLDLFRIMCVMHRHCISILWHYTN